MIITYFFSPKVGSYLHNTCLITATKVGHSDLLLRGSKLAISQSDLYLDFSRHKPHQTSSGYTPPVHVTCHKKSHPDLLLWISSGKVIVPLIQSLRKVQDCLTKLAFFHFVLQKLLVCLINVLLILANKIIFWQQICLHSYRYLPVLQKSTVCLTVVLHQ